MDDSVKVLNTKLVLKTRKVHECYDCGKKCDKSSKMINTVFSYDGKLTSVYKCYQCKNRIMNKDSMERLEEILKEYKEYNKGGLTHAKNEILDLFSVMLSEALNKAEEK